MAYDMVIVGLGNPGPRYARTRHNAGALLLEELARRNGVALRQRRQGALTGEAPIAGRRCLLAFPQTFMNLSGESVVALLGYSGTAPESLLVAHDDLDLPFGRIRLRRGGGSGGHRGVASVIEHLHGPDFARLRIGIGRPPGPVPAEAFVLQEFTPAERERLASVILRACEALECVLAEGLEKAMSLYNRGEADGEEGAPAAPAPA